MQLPVDLEIARDLPPAGSSLREAQQYTRRLATGHYENFTIASWLLPRALRQHFYNVYAYCRWADDLADEIPDPQAALHALDWWLGELQACYGGRTTHPVFIALQETIHRFDLPIDPFQDLLQAFRQDQVVNRYETWASITEYCTYSANPVGRLVLQLFGYEDADRRALSDFTCTGLQLANFWQDVSRDLDKDRIYIPLNLMRDAGLTESDLFARRFDKRYAELMRGLVDRTRDVFRLGQPLARRVAGRFRVDVTLFSHGGLAVLDAIESIGYNTLTRRPTLSLATKMRLAGRVILEYAGSTTGGRLV